MVTETVKPKQVRAFFQALSLAGNVTAACKASGISRATAYRLRESDNIFAERWEESITVAGDVIEQTAFDRAVNGVIVGEEPVIAYGKQVLDQDGKPLVKRTYRYSDALLLKLLEATKPDKYRPSVDINVNWRFKVEQQGINPDELLRDMVHQARQRLIAADAPVMNETALDLQWLEELDSPIES